MTYISHRAQISRCVCCLQKMHFTSLHMSVLATLFYRHSVRNIMAIKLNTIIGLRTLPKTTKLQLQKQNYSLDECIVRIIITVCTICTVCITIIHPNLTESFKSSHLSPSTWLCVSTLSRDRERETTLLHVCGAADSLLPLWWTRNNLHDKPSEPFLSEMSWENCCSILLQVPTGKFTVKSSSADRD